MLVEFSVGIGPVFIMLKSAIDLNTNMAYLEVRYRGMSEESMMLTFFHYLD